MTYNVQQECQRAATTQRLPLIVIRRGDLPPLHVNDVTMTSLVGVPKIGILWDKILEWYFTPNKIQKHIHGNNNIFLPTLVNAYEDVGRPRDDNVDIIGVVPVEEPIWDKEVDVDGNIVPAAELE